jgi:glycosyltransferase involved in cell wall biosynthesis
MSTGADVSVVVPAYNAATFLAGAIDSVLGQTLPPAQVIVVDDGSTDDTPGVIARYAERVTAVRLANGGVARARNAGARMATSRWIAFLDADDEWLPTKLERQIARAGDDVALVYTDRFNVGARGPLPPVQSEIQPLYEGDVFLDLLRLGNHVTLSTVMVRRDVFERLGGFRETFRNAEDWDLWIRLAAEHRVAACHEPLVNYRFHAGMKSGDPAAMWRARVRIVGDALDSPRGQRLAGAERRAVWASTWRTNGWDAGRRGRTADAVSAYARALAYEPLSVASCKGLVLALLGR